MLRLKGFDVERASSVREAVAVLERRRVDAVVLDLSLHGGESGLDLLAWLRARPHHAGTLVLILTGALSLGEDEEALIRRNGAYVFYKPQSYEILLDYLKRMTGLDA